MLNNNINEVIAALQKENFVVIDDHQPGNEYKCTLPLLQVGKNGRINICFGFMKSETQYFSVNPIYIDDDNKPHLSSLSCGGVVDYRYAKDEEEAINQYNEKAKNGYIQDQLTIINIIK